MRKFMLLLIALLSFGAVSAQDYTLESATVNGGGVTVSNGGDYLLGGTTGQADAGISAGGDYVMTSGFWPDDVSIPLVVALSNTSTTVQTVFYISFLLLILGVITAGMLWRHAFLR